MLREKFETKEHTVRENVLVDQHLFCDVCGKEIENEKDYYVLVTGHNDWGNDSCDSVETSDVCSGDCLLKKFHSYINVTEGKVGSDYFEVEHKRYVNRVEHRKKMEALGIAIRRE